MAEEMNSTARNSSQQWCLISFHSYITKSPEGRRLAPLIRDILPKFVISVPFIRSLIRQDMDGHAYGNRYEAKAQCPMFSNKDSAEKQCQP